MTEKDPCFDLRFVNETHYGKEITKNFLYVEDYEEFGVDFVELAQSSEYCSDYLNWLAESGYNPETPSIDSRHEDRAKEFFQDMVFNPLNAAEVGG